MTGRSSALQYYSLYHPLPLSISQSQYGFSEKTLFFLWGKKLDWAGSIRKKEERNRSLLTFNTDLGLSIWIGPLEITDTFSQALASIDWYWLPIFRTNLVRGLSNKEMKFQIQGAVPLWISQPLNQNQSIVWFWFWFRKFRVWTRTSQSISCTTFRPITGGKLLLNFWYTTTTSLSNFH